MMKFISKRLANIALSLIFLLLIFFHLLVITGFIPFDIVWGGRIENSAQMIQFESVSIFVNGILLTIVAIHGGYLKFKITPVIFKITFWMMVILFALNTVGNLYSLNHWEKILFTPLTFLLTLFSLRLALPD